MTDRFTVLASGSGGNAALLEYGAFGLLIDCGLPPRILASRLRSIGTSWDRVSAVVLTHTHSDHWTDATLAELAARLISLYGHREHFAYLEQHSPALGPLKAAGLIREFDSADFELAPGLMCRPVRVSHDSVPTFAFRIDGYDDRPGPAWSVGYASDLGCGSPELVAAFAGVDILALEYNHDEMLERQSSRPRLVIDRVLGDLGHLSNRQAAELTKQIVASSGDGFPSHLVQLHLSRECNTPELAAIAGREALVAYSPATEVVTAKQDVAAKSIPLFRKPNAATRAVPRVPTPLQPKRKTIQPSLPGFDDPA